jgi:hypothetical protein
MAYGSAARSRTRGLAGAVAPTTWRYLTVATLIRAVDGGAAVALVTLVVSRHGELGNATAGLLTALLTAPTLLGPLAAEPLARARDPRRPLAAAFACFGTALTACGLLLDHRDVALAAVAAIAAGCAGPLVTGGLSTQSVAWRPGRQASDGQASEYQASEHQPSEHQPSEHQPSEHRAPERKDGEHQAPERQASERKDGERRAEALDAATYGLGTTVGPLAVAGAVLLFSPLAAVVLLGALALAAAGGALFLPRAAADRLPGRQQGPQPGRDPDSARMPLRQVAAAIAGTGPLRRVLAATTVAALGTGGLLVVAVVFGARLGGHAGGGALLAGAFGVGSLTGSLALTVRPLRTEPEVTTVTLMAATGVSVALCALAPDQAVAAAVFGLTGAVSAAQFTASLAVRSTYAPPGTRAHVYVTMAGLKMGCASVGAALAGALLALGPRLALLAIGGLVVTGAVLAAAMRHAALPAAAGRRRSNAERSGRSNAEA